MKSYFLGEMSADVWCIYRKKFMGEGARKLGAIGRKIWDIWFGFKHVGETDSPDVGDD
jgi:hypothetical protein